MFAYSGQRSRRRAWTSVSVALLIAAFWLAGSALSRLELARFSRQLSAASSVRHDHAQVVLWSFKYGGSEVCASVRVGAEELRRARDIDASAIFDKRGRAREAYIRRCVTEQSRSPFISGLAASMRRQRLARRLDDDEYLEMLAAAVQSIPYARSPDGLRLPVEVAAEGSGICTEKSLLLASLLLHEDYRAVVWVFERRHVAVGVAENGPGFRGSGYSFIETTKPALVGEADPSYRGSGPVTDPPVEIVLGGSRHYGAAHEVDVILDVLARARGDRARLEDYARHALNATGSLRQRYGALAERHRRADQLTRFIDQHRDDRAGLFQALVRDRRAG